MPAKHARLSIGLLIAALISSSISWAEPAAPSAAALLEMGKWWLENGPKLQKALGHDGFSAARPGTPIFFYNDTFDTIVFHYESQRCKKSKETLNPGEYVEFRCKTTSGDVWSKVTFSPKEHTKATTETVPNGHSYYFSRASDTGVLSLNYNFEDEDE